MRRILRFILLKPILWAAAKFSSRPKKERIFTALDNLYKSIHAEPGKRGPVISFDSQTGKFIIFSDQHKGKKNGADDFKLAEPNYMAALAYYYEKGYTFINLGDSEELWENSLWPVKKYNKENFDLEKKFLAADRYIKVFGNHDLFWDNDPFAWWQLKSIFGQKVKVYEGVVLQSSASGQQSAAGSKPLTIFLTHGHQGDASSDGNWFSKFFVAKIWAPLQAYLRINPNTPAYDAERKTLHNDIMYQWSSEQQKLVLITGHTHQPVFASLTHLERLYKQLLDAIKRDDKAQQDAVRKEIRLREKDFTSVSVDYMQMKPSYFNSGCCCFSDGDITGIEIEGGEIRLVKWSAQKGREPLESSPLSDLSL